MLRMIVAIAFLGLTACALPRERELGQDFIGERDLAAVSLARQGIEFYRNSRLAEAEFALRQALYLYPSPPNVRANLAQVLSASGQHTEALLILERLTSEYSESVEFAEMLARATLEQGDYESAQRKLGALFDRVLNRADFAAAARIARTRAVLAYRLGSEADALCYSEVALALKHDGAEMARHARLLLALNRDTQVLQLLTAYLNEAGSSREAEVLLPLALVQYERGAYADARETQRRALDTVSGNESAQREVSLLGELLKRRLKPDDAEVSEQTQKLAKGLLEFSTDARLLWPQKFAAGVRELAGS